MGGFAEQSDLTLVTASRQFSIAPEPEQTVLILGKVYRIREKTTSPCQTFYVLTLYDPTRGV
jgi:hypothetical protein